MADTRAVRRLPPASEPMPSPDSHVKFDRNGTSYVEYEHLRNSPKVQRQIAAARRIVTGQQATSAGSGASIAAATRVRGTKR